MVQWLRLHASNAGHVGSIPGQGTKIPHAMKPGKKKKIQETNTIRRDSYTITEESIKRGGGTGYSA